MWPRRSHMLATLTKLTYTKWRFEWTQAEQDAFNKISGSFHATLFLHIQILMKQLKLIPMLSRSN